MPSTVKALILRAAGTNCDYEMAHAFETAGAEIEYVHINRLVRRERTLDEFHILGVPGGFTYGDDISAGKIQANEFKYKLADDLTRFVEKGKLILGICNGFQALVKASLLPDIHGLFGRQEATLFNNDVGRFRCEWIRLKAVDQGKCVFTRGLEYILEAPIAHGEGRFVPGAPADLRALWENRQIVFQYVDSQGCVVPEVNPNGSVDAIAGVCDPTGRILALMPHPERHVHPTQHPRWTREGLQSDQNGLKLFQNAVEYARQL
ncbi:MAG: phosphoribosylformylglycinamidine synthase I [Armatimonadetes bacterium]|nr:phosphoribosylformylglycinamidine synthase I [Armatimonadota bacterium]